MIKAQQRILAYSDDNPPDAFRNAVMPGKCSNEIIDTVVDATKLVCPVMRVNNSRAAKDFALSLKSAGYAVLLKKYKDPSGVDNYFVSFSPKQDQNIEGAAWFCYSLSWIEYSNM